MARKANVPAMLKIYGYSIQKEASDMVSSQLENVRTGELDDWIETLIEALQKQSLSSNVLDLKSVKAALKDLSADGGIDDTIAVDASSSDVNEEPFISVIDAFTVPRFMYDAETEKYKKTPNQALLGGIDNKIEIFRERYNSVWQRTIRHQLFTAAHRKAQSAQFSLQKVEYLKGVSLKMKDVVILGMLAQIKEGEWWIEDPTGAIPINLKDAVFHKGIFTESALVLAEGTFSDGILDVTAFGFPPSEPGSKSRQYFGTTNFFGGKRVTNVGSSERLQAMEIQSENSICVLSDVQLDNSSCLEKLFKLVEGFASAPPMAFIICGDFLENPHSFDSFTVLKKAFEKLARKVVELEMRDSYFVFVPGPTDPCLGDCLPRPAIPDSIISPYIKQKLKHWHFVSNPCRMTIFSQEVVIFRSDIMSKLMRHAIREPSGELPELTVKTILSQAHLAPFPQRLSPIYWGWDHSLRLFPLPDVLILADSNQSFNLTSCGTICMNPSSFNRDGNFYVYYPKEKAVENSRVE